MWWLGVTCDRKGYPQSRTFSPPRTASSWKLGVFAQWRRALRSGTTWSPWRPGQLLCLGSRAGVKLYLSYVYYDLLAWNWSWKKINDIRVCPNLHGRSSGRKNTNFLARFSDKWCCVVRHGVSPHQEWNEPYLIWLVQWRKQNRTIQDNIKFDLHPSCFSHFGQHQKMTLPTLPKYDKIIVKRGLIDKF